MTLRQFCCEVCERNPTCENDCGSCYPGATLPEGVERGVPDATTIAALLRRVGGRAVFTEGELARAAKARVERRENGATVEMRVVEEGT